MAGKGRLCTKCKVAAAPAYHDWCLGCHAARREERERAQRQADPGRASWVRDWQRLRMRQYRGHEMREEPCRECHAEKATLMVLRQNPLQWTVLCRACRERLFPNRDVTGRRKKPQRTTSLVLRSRLQRETRELGL